MPFARGVHRAAAALAALVPTASALHAQTARGPEEADGAGGDLVFMHVPYNFGHTIEKVALFPSDQTWMQSWSFIKTLGGLSGKKARGSDTTAIWKQVHKHMRKGGRAWGHFNPDLLQESPETGCGLYFSPQKFWPKDLAAQYFGNKTIFGMLRDPYERLVAMFRGTSLMDFTKADYGTAFDRDFVKQCNVNAGIKDALKKYMASDNKFASGCTFLPQAEYFEGEYGITLPVDNRLFPDSMNKVFSEHGYSEHISTKDIGHVLACTEVWAADLDAETRALVRHIYKKDFDLLCKHFGYCDVEENTCIKGVPMMCPKSQCTDGKCPQEDWLGRLR